jgi:phytoene dehydrogenase-like protein
MIAVSNPCVLDHNLAPEGYMVLHAYGAANEPFELWTHLKRNSPEYIKLKEERAEVLWRAVESIIPDVHERVVYHLVGSPLTHERFLRRPHGSYGAATEDYLNDGSTPYDNLFLAGDGIFPGIGTIALEFKAFDKSSINEFLIANPFIVSGVPAVALSGAAAANALVSPFRQWRCLDELKQKQLI